MFPSVMVAMLYVMLFVSMEFIPEIKLLFDITMIIEVD
jgi:hypothetical protein